MSIPQIVIPRDKRFLLDLILQRTGYLIESGNGKALNEWTETGSTLLLENLIDDDVWRKNFLSYILDSASEDAESLASALHSNSKSNVICSIGPGNGIVELLLIQILQPKMLILIDIEQTPTAHHHGWEKSGAGYASLISTVKFIRSNMKQMNLYKHPSICIVNPLIEHLPEVEIDLCFSLLSAGFHYPIDEYMAFFKSTLGNNGPSHLIYDARSIDENRKKIHSLHEQVQELNPLLKHPKFSRLHFLVG